MLYNTFEAWVKLEGLALILTISQFNCRVLVIQYGSFVRDERNNAQFPS